MSDSSYSLDEVVRDGKITAPRWMHHVVVKLCAQHTAPAFMLWCLTGRPVLSALIAGPGVYAGIVVRKLWTRAPRNIPDWIRDGALAVMPVSGAYFARHDWLTGGLILSACAAVWLALHKRATP